MYDVDLGDYLRGRSGSSPILCEHCSSALPRRKSTTGCLKPPQSRLIPILPRVVGFSPRPAFPHPVLRAVAGHVLTALATRTAVPAAGDGRSPARARSTAATRAASAPGATGSASPLPRPALGWHPFWWFLRAADASKFTPSVLHFPYPFLPSKPANSHDSRAHPSIESKGCVLFDYTLCVCTG